MSSDASSNNGRGGPGKGEDGRDAMPTPLASFRYDNVEAAGSPEAIRERARAALARGLFATLEEAEAFELAMQASIEAHYRGDAAARDQLVSSAVAPKRGSSS